MHRLLSALPKWCCPGAVWFQDRGELTVGDEVQVADGDAVGKGVLVPFHHVIDAAIAHMLVTLLFVA